jgi:hypothetical protein
VRRWDRVQHLPAAKSTTDRDAADRFGIRWIRERDRPGLSLDASVLHHGHSSGYQLLGLALHAGAERVILLGYDLRFAPDYDPVSRQPGSQPRHFFGEYEPELQHWPKQSVRDGVHLQLLDLYRSVATQGALKVIDSSFGALDCFERVDIADVD